MSRFHCMDWCGKLFLAKLFPNISYPIIFLLMTIMLLRSWLLNCSLTKAIILLVLIRYHSILYTSVHVLQLVVMSDKPC